MIQSNEQTKGQSSGDDYVGTRREEKYWTRCGMVGMTKNSIKKDAKWQTESQESRDGGKNITINKRTISSQNQKDYLHHDSEKAVPLSTCKSYKIIELLS